MLFGHINFYSDIMRIPIFAFLGPPLSFLVLALLVDLGGGHLFRQWQFVLPVVYCIALVPFLLCAWFDYHLRDERSWYRASFVGVVAAIMAIIIVLIGSALTGDTRLDTLLLALAGMLPTVACSWLTTTFCRSIAGRQEAENEPEQAG